MTEVEVSITVNGASRTLRIDPRMSPLDLLRDRLGLLTEPGPSAITDDLTVDPPLTPGEIRERMSGNLCRRGGFVRRDLSTTPAKLLE